MNFQSNTSKSNSEKDSQSIGVRIAGLSDTDTAKITKILHLSIHRKYKYHHCDNLSNSNQAQIIITSDFNQPSESGMIPITFGKKTGANPHHLCPPLLSLRVLRILDNIYLHEISSQLKNTPSVDKKVTPDKAINNELKNPIEPIKQASPNPSQNIINELAYAEDPEFDYQILIVDDSALIYKALEIELNNAPFSSNKYYAESGEACLQLANKNVYDIIFLDIMMPGIDGFKTCTELRKNPKFKKTPIIMLSSKTSPLDEVNGIMAGCTTYLTKPIRHEEFQKLLGRLGNWLENYKIA